MCGNIHYICYMRLYSLYSPYAAIFTTCGKTLYSLYGHNIRCVQLFLLSLLHASIFTFFLLYASLYSLYAAAFAIICGYTHYMQLYSLYSEYAVILAICSYLRYIHYMRLYSLCGYIRYMRLYSLYAAIFTIFGIWGYICYGRRTTRIQKRPLGKKSTQLASVLRGEYAESTRNITRALWGIWGVGRLVGQESLISKHLPSHGNNHCM